MEEIKYKQYVLVPKKPRMSKGKMASQVAHATFMALEKQKMFINPTKEISDLIQNWKFGGMCVIVLEVKNTEQLSNVAKYLDQWNIPNYLYIDEGLTEVYPMTPTALATGIITEDKFWIFEQFELFGEKQDAQSLIDNITINIPLCCGACMDKGTIRGCEYCGRIKHKGL